MEERTRKTIRSRASVRRMGKGTPHGVRGGHDPRSKGGEDRGGRDYSPLTTIVSNLTIPDLFPGPAREHSSKQNTQSRLRESPGGATPAGGLVTGSTWFRGEYGQIVHKPSGTRKALSDPGHYSLTRPGPRIVHQPTFEPGRGEVGRDG